MNLITKLIDKLSPIKFIDFDKFYDKINRNSRIAVKDIKMFEKEVTDFRQFPISQQYIADFNNATNKYFEDINLVTNSPGYSGALADVLDYIRWYCFCYAVGNEEFRNSYNEIGKLNVRFEKLYDLVLYSLFKHVCLDNNEVIFYEDGTIKFEEETKHRPEINFSFKIMKDIKELQVAVNEKNITKVKEFLEVFSDELYCEKYLEGAKIFEL